MSKRRFTDSQAIEIHARIKNGESRKSVARIYGVDETIIKDIASARSYRHLGLEAMIGKTSDPKDFKQRMDECVVKQESGCWEWMGRRCPSGYGVFKRGISSKRAHCESYKYHIGPIPDGLYVLHECDNPACVNPDHLTVGTQLDNMYGMVTRGRAAVGSRNARAALTEEQVKQIVRLLDSGGTQRGIARWFRVSARCIQHIAHGDTWSHVSGRVCRRNEGRYGGNLESTIVGESK